MIKILITIFILSPLIKCNYYQRIRGKLPDEWYWADVLVLDWGCVKYCWAY